MTLPNERYNSIVRTREFLRSLLDPKQTPRIPKEIRTKAYYCLRHFIDNYQLELMAEEFPEILRSDKWKV